MKIMSKSMRHQLSMFNNNMYDCTCFSSHNDHGKEIWVMNYWSKKRKDDFSSESADLSKMIRWENMKDLC